MLESAFCGHEKETRYMGNDESQALELMKYVYVTIVYPCGVMNIQD